MAWVQITNESFLLLETDHSFSSRSWELEDIEQSESLHLSVHFGSNYKALHISCLCFVQELDQQKALLYRQAIHDEKVMLASAVEGEQPYCQFSTSAGEPGTKCGTHHTCKKLSYLSGKANEARLALR